MISPIRRILVARDFSPPSEAALRLALRLAARADATLHLLHVEVLDEDPYGRPDEAASPAARLRERLKNVFERDRVEGLPYEPESLRLEHALVREVEAGPAIVRHAAAIDADLVVMGRHGRRGMGRAVLGSVAEYVASEAPCPVLTVPAAAGLGNPSVLCASDLSRDSRAAVEIAAKLAVSLGARLDLVHAAPTFGDLSARDQLQAMAEDVLGEHDLGLTIHVPRGDAAEAILDTMERLAPMMLVVGPRKHTGLSRLLGSVTEAVLHEAAAPVVAVPRAEEPVPA